MTSFTIAQQLQSVLSLIAQTSERHGRNADNIRLIAVSKKQAVQAILSAANAGQRDFAENYLQEAIPKIQNLQGNHLCWHFIGRLQSNKLKDIATHFDWVHTLVSVRHVERLAAARPDGLGPLRICLQVNISDEITKGGIKHTDKSALCALANAVLRLSLIHI